MPRALALALALWAALPQPARAELGTQSLRVGSELSVRVYDGYPLPSDRGFGPGVVGLTLTNRGDERSVKLELRGEAHLVQQLRLPAHEPLRTFLYVPLRGWPGAELGSLRVTDLASGASSAVDIRVGVTDKLPLARLGAISAALNVNEPWELIGALDAHLPDDWRGLSGLQAIVVEHAQLAAVSGSWPALRDWVTAGGLLLIVSTPEQLAQPQPLAAELAFEAAPVETEGGLVQRAGVGAIARVHPALLAEVDGDLRARLGLAPVEQMTLTHSSFSDVTRRSQLRLAALVHTHPGALALVLSAFVVLVGPLGYARFLRRSVAQPLAYLVFTACTALVFSLAVLLADLLSNGLAIKAAARSLILIDQRRDRELGVEDLALYEPTGLGYELQPWAAGQLFLPEYAADDEGPDWEPAVGGDRRARLRGALPPRTPRFVGLRWQGPASGRLLTAAAVGGGLQVENQLGRDLRELSLWHDGAFYTLGPLARGQRALARPAADPTAGPAITPPESPLVRAQAALWSALDAGRLGPNRYRARVAWQPELSALAPGALELAPEPELVIAGVY